MGYGSVSWPLSKHHRCHVTAFPLKFSLFSEMTKVSTGPQPLGHCSCPSQEMYLIKIHQTPSFNEGEATIAV
jgi:hypothetical protein